MAVRATGRRNNDPTAFGVDEGADVVVREVVTPRFGHRDVIPRTTDNNLGNGLLAPLHLLRRTIEL